MYPTTNPLLWSIRVCSGGVPGRKGACGLIQILQRAAPEQRVLAVGGEVVVEAGDESIVIQADRGAETEAGIIEPSPTEESLVTNLPVQ